LRQAFELRRIDAWPGISHDEEDIATVLFGADQQLSICRSIIDAHGGRLWAGANEPRGAVFRFTMPGAEVAP
jgi:K+-sensing histidine kinase KdpD